MENRILALTALKTSIASRKLLPPFDQIPERGKLNVQNFMSQIDIAEIEKDPILTKSKNKKSKIAKQMQKAQVENQVEKVRDIDNSELKNVVIQAVVQNMAKVLNAVCDENVEALKEIPTMADQINNAIITSPHQNSKFTPFLLNEFDNVPQKRKQIHQFNELIVNATIDDIDDAPYLNQSIYSNDNCDDIFYVESLIPTNVFNNRSAEPQSFEQVKLLNDTQYDPETLAIDSPEFAFIPTEIKFYIYRMVKKELIHWPAFLQELGKGFNWPTYTHTGELIQFSPMR